MLLTICLYAIKILHQILLLLEMPTAMSLLTPTSCAEPASRAKV